MVEIWTEKYRPKKFEDIVGLDPKIKDMCFNGNQHFLFLGSVGCGKSTTARVIIKELQATVLLLNASDERGINTVRDKVKNFAQNMSPDNKPRIVFLDEADALTLDAQNSLRNIMETYHTNCRFILTGNYSNKIIDALKSRCEIFEFKQLGEENIKKYLQKIIEKEGLVVEEGVVDLLISNNKTDIRSMINTMQSFAGNKKIALEDIVKNGSEVSRIVKFLKEGSFSKAQKVMLDLLIEPETIISELHEWIIKDRELSGSIKKEVIKHLADSSRHIAFVPFKELEIEALFINIIEEIRK